MKSECTPVVIFVYRRKIAALLEQLRKNPEASQTDLYIFSDGYRNDSDRDDVLQTRASLKQVEGFQHVDVIEAERNMGLANAIISGVTRIISRYGRVIVLEDDLAVADDFLQYMNEALHVYAQDHNVWSVSGYGPKLPCLEAYDKDVYLTERVCSWGWASWRDRWETIDWEVSDFEALQHDKALRRRFEAAGDDLYKMLELQMLGKLDSWAIRWQYNQFMQQRYTLYPTFSKTAVGSAADSVGTHNSGQMKKWDVEPKHGRVRLEALQVDPEILACFGRFYNLGTATKIGYALKKFGGYELARKLYRHLQKRGMK